MVLNITNTDGATSKIIINDSSKINIYNNGKVNSIVEVNGLGKEEINLHQELIIWHITNGLIIGLLVLVALFIYIGYSLYQSKKLKKEETNLVFQEFENQEKEILSLLEQNYKSDIFKNKIKTLLKELREKFLIEKEDVLLKLERLKKEFYQEIEDDKDDFDEVMKYVNIVNLAKGKNILNEEAIVKIVGRLNFCEFYQSIAFVFLRDISEALKYIKATPTVYKFEQYFNKNNLLNLATKVRKNEVLSNKILELSETSFSSEFQRELIKELEKFFRGA